MIAPDDIPSDGPREDVVDNVEFLSNALCTPVTVVLTRLTMKDINDYCMKRKKRRRDLTWRFGYEKRIFRNIGKKLSPKGIRKARRRNEERMADVDKQESSCEKTDINKEKPRMEEFKTDTLTGGENGKGLQKKRKSIDAFERKGNTLPRKRTKRLSVTTRIRAGTEKDAELSSRYTKDDCVKHMLSNTKQLQVSLTKLEHIKDDVHVDIWRSKSLRTKSTASGLMFETEKDRQLSEVLGSVALHLNEIYPMKANKKRDQIDSSDPLPQRKTKSNLPTNTRKLRKKSLKVQSQNRLRRGHKLPKDPKIVLRKLDRKELSTHQSSVCNNQCMTMKYRPNHNLDETERVSDNDDDDPDLINEIISLTNRAQHIKESKTVLDKTLSMSSPESSPRPSPILGKSPAKYKSKLQCNLLNIQSTVKKTSSEKSRSDIKRGISRPESLGKPTQKYSKTTSIFAECDNDNLEDAEDFATEFRLQESPGRPSSRIAAKSKSSAAGRVTKKVWPKKKHATRSLSRMELNSPSTSLSRSPSPVVRTESSEIVAHVRNKSGCGPSGALKRISSSAVTDASNKAETRSLDKESSLSSSRVISVDNNDTTVNGKPEQSPSASPARSTQNNLAASSIEETNVSPSKSARRSPARPSIHSPCRPTKTPTSISPKSSAKSSATETETSNSDNLQESEKPISDSQIITTTDASEVEDAPAAVGHEIESVSSEDEDSIELIIDDDSTKEVTNSTSSTLPLPNSNSELSTDQDQVVPMQESPAEFSHSNTETNIYKIHDPRISRNVAGAKRATSVITTQRNAISDILDKKQKSATPKLLSTRRIKALGRVSLGRTKGEKLKTGSKSRNTLTSLKCIICDSEYKTYELLQEHLRTHSRRQSPSTSGILPTDPCPDSMLDANKREKTFQDIGAPPTTCSKTACSVASSSKSNQERRSLSTEVIECTSETSDVTSTTSTQSHPSQKKPEVSPSKAVKSKEKKIKYCNSSSTCSVCFQKFKSKDKLAAHIYVHTEEELQKAYESARAAKSSNDQSESVRVTLEESNVPDNVESNTSSTTVEASNNQDVDTDDFASTPVFKNRECQPETAPIAQSRLDKEGKREDAKRNSEKLKKPPQKEKVASISSGKQVTVPKTKNPSKEKKSERTVDPIEVITLEESESQNDTTDNNVSTRTDTDGNTESDTIIGITKPITVCECHRNDVTYGNYLRIEVSLLCHSCRTVYRSMECFEIHYRLPQNAECNKNRLHGRSPKLFCTNCGMIFSSIQDVRQHLEVHARYNANVSTDFRCNLCKVIFVGIGSQFYIHWSNHLKNPLYIASKLSFPKNAVLASKSKYTKATKESTPDEYLYVAEHICDSCKEPFSTGTDLEKHLSSCKQNPNETTTNTTTNPNNDISVEPKIRLVCGICEQIFLDKLHFEKHAELKHKQHTEPQYICVALTTMSTVFSCSACTKMYGKLQDLETHWKTHNTKRERYMCKNCDKLYDSLESFVDHAKQHVSDLSNGVVSCKVIYQESEFICKTCKFGFDSKVTMNKHFEMHGVSMAWRNTEVTIQQQPTDLCTSKTGAADPLQIPESEKTKENDRMKNVVTGNQQQEEQERTSIVGNDTHVSDTNEVPSSCGQEEAEASEGELVIDYKEMSENDRLQKTPKKATPTIFESLNTPIANNGATEDLDKGCTSIAPTKEANKSTNCTEELPSHKIEPPRKGFLRVKTLAELTEDNITTRTAQCSICKTILNNSDELASHILTAHTNDSAEQITMNQTIGQGSSQNISQPEPMQNIASNTKPQPINSGLPNTTEHRPMLLIDGHLIALNIQSKTDEIPQQQKPTWHTSEERPVIPNNTPKPVSGYHKNLPACPSTRPLSTATQRAPVRNARFVPSRPKESSSSSAILKIPQPTAPGQPQPEQACRTTVYQQAQRRFVQDPSTSNATNIALTSTQSIPSTAIQRADSYGCKICPQFKGASVADYLLHALSPDHWGHNKTPAPQASIVQNLSYNNYGQVITEANSNVRTPSLNSVSVAQNQPQQQERLQVYATNVYSEPVTYAPVQANRIINYTIPSTALVTARNLSQTAPLNSQILIATPNARTVYQPIVFNNSSGIAVMNNGMCFFCSTSFANDNLLRLHISTKHPYACILCRKNFASPHELQAHKINHNLGWD